MNTDYSLVLTYRYPGTEWRMSDFDYDTLDWLDSSPKPTREDLDMMWGSVQAEMEAEVLAKEAAKESAFAKLAKLGLTPEEAIALFS